jgi:hypothetical protein
LVAIYDLADNFELIESAPALVLLGSIVPSLAWSAYFFAVRRSSIGARLVTWMTLGFAVLLEAVVAVIRFQHSVNYWSPFGNVLNPYGWILRLGWAVFLIFFALAPDHSRTRKMALILAIASAPSTLSTAFNEWNSWIGLLFEGIPKEAFWRVVITPAIRSVYWLSQILYLWSAWSQPSQLDASSARLTP